MDMQTVKRHHKPPLIFSKWGKYAKTEFLSDCKNAVIYPIYKEREIKNNSVPVLGKILSGFLAGK